MEGDANKQVGEFGGTYEYHNNQYINGRKYWLRSGYKAMWYIPEYKDWAIGRESYLGGTLRFITSVSDLRTTCPNNRSNSWKYWDDSNWISTNGVELNCEGM